MKKNAHESVDAAAVMSVGDALRAVGFGEKALAREMRALVVQLREKPDSSKLLLDTLKECGRHLCAPRATAEECDEGAGVQVELVHNVARPGRGTSGGKQIGFQFEKETT